MHTPLPPGFYTAEDYLALPCEPSAWLITRVLPVGGAVMIYGDPKAGKSYMALQLARSVITGEPFLNFETRTTGDVVYLQIDTPVSTWRNGFDADDIDPEFPDGHYLRRLQRQGLFPFVGKAGERMIFCDRATLDEWDFDILKPETYGKMRAGIEAIKPALVIVDTLRESHNGSENDSDDMKRVIASMVRTCQPAAVLFLHHAKKPSFDQGADGRNDMRGGYSSGRMDTTFKLMQKTMFYFGRTTKDTTVKVEWEPSGFRHIVDDAMDNAVKVMFDAEPGLSTREASRRLALQMGKTEAACRAFIRRHRKDSPDESV